MLSVDRPDDGSEQPPLLSPSELPTVEPREVEPREVESSEVESREVEPRKVESREVGSPAIQPPEVETLDQALDDLLSEAVLKRAVLEHAVLEPAVHDRDQVADRRTAIGPDEPPWLEPTPERRLPWRSTAFAASAQIPAVIAAATLDISLVMLSVQVVIVAAMGVLLVLAEWMNLNRYGLAPEEPRPTLDRQAN